MPRDRICIDFDGVIHLLDNWEPGQSVTVIAGEAVPGTREAIAQLRETYEVVVLSCRAEKAQGRRAIAQWLKEQGIKVDRITAQKLPALVYVDDRALHFYGDWAETLRDIKDFRPWRPWRKECRA